MKFRWTYFLEDVAKLQIIRMSPNDLLEAYDHWLQAGEPNKDEWERLQRKASEVKDV